MAHDPKREDYLRLSLRFVHELDAGDPAAATRAFATFGRRFAQDRDSLPQSDADRAFYLMALACEVVDYRLPFAAEAQADELIARGKSLLDEALSLDPACFDALRMRSSTECPTVEERYQFLVEREPEVHAACEAARTQALAGEGAESEDAVRTDRAALAADLAMRPWLRWMASVAEEALICGRNRACIDACERLLAADPYDSCDVRFTLAYALAKLEDEEGLAELGRRYATISPLRPDDDPWILLARTALAHKRCDFATARACLGQILASYPNAGAALIRQMELPDGEFSRLHVAPYSEDELILAVSEGIVLFQEGVDRTGKGVFGAWVAKTVAELDPSAAAVVRAQETKGAEER